LDLAAKAQRREKEMRVELHIEELVLHGFSSRDRYAIAAAVEQTLSQLFAVHGVPYSFTESSEQARLDAGAFNIAPRANSEVIGSQIAQSVHRGLTR